ncbi:histidine kinase [Rhizobium sp. 2YAF20]|uniref:histidine kinase n=1 Tax=Rhizobium sp. 2YAF20 TaxID=3233027 RepID=UPI003F95E389
MQKKLLLAAAFSTILPVLAFADTIKFPSEEPIASITIPHSWGPKETETGVDATSDDSAVYFSIDIADSKTTDKVVGDAIDFLSKNGVTIDKSTQHDEGDHVVNGMKMSTLGWSGTDKDGPVDVQLGFVQPKEDKLLVVTYWGSKDGDDKHDKEVAAMIQSLVPVKE